jgi:pentapeptide MXKDX repeat protein
VLAGVSNAVVVGDRRRFLAVLLWLKVQRTAAPSAARRPVASNSSRSANTNATMWSARRAGTGCTRMLAELQVEVSDNGAYSNRLSAHAIEASRSGARTVSAHSIRPFRKAAAASAATANQCNAMQCNATRCNAMPYDAIRCNAMQFDAMQCNAKRCNAMQCNAMRCNVMRCNAMRCKCDAMQRDAMQTNAMRCDAMRCDAMECARVRPHGAGR